MFEPVSRRAALKQLAAAGAARPSARSSSAARPRRFGSPACRSRSRSRRSARSPCASPSPPSSEPAACRTTARWSRRRKGSRWRARRDGRRVHAVRAGNLTVRYTADPPAIHIDTIKGQPVQRLALSADEPGLSFLLPKGPLLGLGEGGPQFDRKGSVDRMRNGQGGYQLRTHGGRVPIQWLVGTDGWGMFIHHPLGAFDFSGAEGRLTPAADALPLDVFIVASADPEVIVGEYARITGHAELPPLWSFGYLQSHRTLAGPDEVMWVAKTFREKKLPCDALIYLGTEFTPSGWNTRNGEFAWKKENFPDPKKAIDDLHALHYKVVLHSVIEGRRMSGTVARIPARRTRPCRADARRTTAGRKIARSNATGRITSR